MGVGLALTAGLLGSTALSTAALAQVERIVVTSERRETELQDTPISVLAFTADVMERQGVEDLQDMSLFAPNLTISGSRGTGVNQPTFMIRGISGGGGAISERGVALYIDGIYVPRTNGSIFQVLDMERIEVLRGPQGTLFGRNSTGGAIRMFSAQPGEEQEGYVRATVGEMNRTDLIGMVNLPVSDAVSLRFQGGYLNEDGWVSRGTQDLGGSEDWVGRAQAKVDFTNNVSATFGLLYSDSQSEGSPQDVETFDMRPGVEGVFDGNFADWMSDSLEGAGQPPIIPFNDPRIVLDDFTMPDFCLIDDFDPDWDEACALSNDSVYWQADANVTWDLTDTLRLTSITGVAEMDHTGLTSWQQLGFELRPDNVKSEVIYQEFQLNAALFGGAIDFVTGINYFYEDSSSVGRVLTRRGSSTTATPPTWNNDPDGDGIPGRAGPVGGVQNGDGGLFVTDDLDTNQESTSWGWFNSATWHMTDKANLTLGARLAFDEKDYTQTEFQSANFSAFDGISTTVDTSDDWTEVDWRATFDYHFTDDLMAYATASKAYSAGQFSFAIIDNRAGDLQSGDFIKAIPPEQVINYEVGARMTFGDRLVLNPTVFSMEWSNRQAARQIACTAGEISSGACPVGFQIFVVDSGDVDIYGTEIDAQLYLTDDLVLTGAYGYTDYELKDPVANSGPYLFPEPPAHSGSVGGLYRTSLGSSGDLDFSLNYAYVDEQRTHPTSDTDSDYLQPSYGLVNGRVQWTSPDDRYSVALFANNLLDETYAVYSTRFGGGFWDAGPGLGFAAPQRSSLNVVRGQPRQVGVTLQVNF
jgi:iron complex outermembrane receptor protein